MKHRGLANVVPRKTVKKRGRRVDLSDSDSDDTPQKSTRVTVRSHAASKQSKKAEKLKWFVAIDLGTTYTTIAWHRSDMPLDLLRTVDDMPGEQNLDRVGNQIRTALWYPSEEAEPKPGVTQSDIRLRFGEEITELEAMPSSRPLRSIYRPSGQVAMIKLLLDQSEYAQEAKTELKKVLNSLKTAGHIEEDEQVLFDIVLEILRATQDRLRAVGLKDDSDVEMTFCVPVCWTPSATAVMSAAFEAAMKTLRFGTDGDSPCHLFIVHEAEAQAMHALKSFGDVLKRGETFILIDCGGGTTDIGIYSIASATPLRLGNEIHEACGAMVGAGDLNARFRRYVKKLLCNEHYLDVDLAVEAEVMNRFESRGKRVFTYAVKKEGFWYPLRGLQQSSDDVRIQNDGFELTWDDMWRIFQPVVTKIANMMIAQVFRAAKARHVVDKIVVVGGFGDSQCLREYLTDKIDAYNSSTDSDIQLCFPARNGSATGVATGAILRAVDKSGGPSRITSQSIGMLRHIPADERSRYSHAVYSQPAEDDDEDGCRYIWDTIEWKVVKGDRVNAVHDLSYTATHSFRKDQEWIIEEILYASEECNESFFKLSHPKNDGKVTEVGRVEFDIRHMKDRIQQSNRRHDLWEDSVEILIEMQVIDRNIEFTARWPANSAGQVIQGSRRFFSVASAFVPGTQ